MLLSVSPVMDIPRVYPTFRDRLQLPHDPELDKKLGITDE